MLARQPFFILFLIRHWVGLSSFELLLIGFVATAEKRITFPNLNGLGSKADIQLIIELYVNMLKKDLVDKVSDELSLQKQDVNMAVDIMLEAMTQALIEERRIELRGFGSFSVRSRKPRSTKNPRTGKIMDIPHRKTLHFTMSKSLKEALINEKE